jgi:DNA excision repair protein ERCC-2
MDGIEIHTRIQKQRAKKDPLYQAEVAVSNLFERGGFSFRIDGRMDGIFRHNQPKIEEIKTSFSIRELSQRLSDNTFNQPYCLQLLTYGYFHWREYKIIPNLSFHLVSSRNNENSDIEIQLDIPQYEQWLDLRLDELVLEATQAEKSAARRRKVATNLTFPFEDPRPGQIDLMRMIEQFMQEKRPMLIQAPTGLGKTVGVLYPVLKEALGRGERVFYLTPKNSQHSVAEDAITRFQEAGAKIKSLTITAKSKICLKNEPLCNPDYCEYALNYYGKIHEHSLLPLLAKKRKLKARTFRDMGKEYQVCPFELQLDSAREVDVIICDYNYVFAPRSALSRITGIVVDQTRQRPCERQTPPTRHGGPW